MLAERNITNEFSSWDKKRKLKYSKALIKVAEAMGMDNSEMIDGYGRIKYLEIIAKLPSFGVEELKRARFFDDPKCDKNGSVMPSRILAVTYRVLNPNEKFKEPEEFDGLIKDIKEKNYPQNVTLGDLVINFYSSRIHEGSRAIEG